MASVMKSSISIICRTLNTENEALRPPAYTHMRMYAGGFIALFDLTESIFRYFKKFDILYGKAKKAML